MELERRFTENVELRAEPEDKGVVLEGHPAMYDKLSQNLGGFKEKLEPGAFTRTLKERPDVRALFNHDMNFVLGRSVKSKTLELSEDQQGLFMRAHPPDTQMINDLVITPIQRGDVDQMSFAFYTRKEAWEELKKPDSDGVKYYRTVLDLDLVDVSVVTYPAYEQTRVKVAKRSLMLFQESLAQEDMPDWLTECDLEFLCNTYRRLHDGQTVADAELNRTVDMIDSITTAFACINGSCNPERRDTLEAVAPVDETDEGDEIVEVEKPLLSELDTLDGRLQEITNNLSTLKQERS